MPQYAYKLLNPDLTTYGGCQWVVGEWKETNGEGDLCGVGWLHAYPSPTIAHFLNPIHASFSKPVLYRVEVGGRKKNDSGLKVGYTRMLLDKEWPMRVPTTEQRVRFAIACAASVYAAPTFLEWAGSWVKNIDRSWAAAEAARAAAAEARAAAARAAAWAAAAAAKLYQDLNLETLAQWAMSDSVTLPVTDK